MTSWGQYLVSGPGDKTVKIWSSEGDGSWPCLGTIAVHTGGVKAVVVWEGRVISGSDDKKIKVSNIVSLQHEATLDAHTGEVFAFAVSGQTLFSTGDDFTIGVWALGTWSHLRMVRVSGHMPDAGCCHCLAVSGSMLLCGGQCNDDGSGGFVAVLDADTQTYLHTLELDHCVDSLLSVRGEVWGTLWYGAVLAWGKAERGGGSGTSEAGRT